MENMQNNHLPSNQNKENNLSIRKIAYFIYIAYLAGIILPILPLVGVMFAYIFENDAILHLKSHYQYIIRTFWIGFLYSIISGILWFIGIGVVISVLCLIWWIVRIAKGIKFLMRDEPVADPTTWWF